MKSVRKPSVVPVYGVAAVWLGYTLWFGLGSVAQLLLCAAVSVAAYFILKSIFPGKTVQVEVPQPPPDTGDKQLDEAIAAGRKQIADIRRLNGLIPDAQVTRTLSDIEETTRKILGQLERDKSQVKRCRQFLDYYLPTTIQLLEQYVKLQDQGVRAGNIDEAMGKIEKTLTTIQGAFRKQLDALFAQDVVDITADITVMEQLLRAQGLTQEENEPFK
ncbi:MAG: hypothetical protein HFF17_15010 [Oscillospiraceae bacterium]|nr:hypothetical protein [Oscillospiraceae bacterium]